MKQVFYIEEKYTGVIKRRDKLWIVHMYVSIDGKIDGSYGSAISGRYYSDELFVMSNADANGRETISMYAAPAEIDFKAYGAEGIEYVDWIPDVKSETWSVAFDRKGSAAGIVIISNTTDTECMRLKCLLSRRQRNTLLF